eukprot:112_1
MHARRTSFSMRQIVALKLYTDFDQLQREFRMCFREKNENDRIKRQKQFFFWNNLLENACKKSHDTVAKKLYHGINDGKLYASCFSGTYYGPVSTTTDLTVAKGFAGDHGQILELYPSFGAKGLNVSWLSNFPDENEVLYMNVSFQISDIIKISPANYTYENEFKHNDYLEHKKISSVTMERCILNALQTINIDSNIISLNDNDQNEDLSNFRKLRSYEKLAVLYLLYLQYRPKEWNDLLKSNEKYLS